MSTHVGNSDSVSPAAASGSTIQAEAAERQLTDMRVALVHYWLVGMRGGEKVLEALIRMFPQADVFTHVLDRQSVSSVIANQRVVETYIGKLPFAKKLYQTYLPLMPSALEALDLTGYDLVISSEAGPAKGVIVPPDALHVCYCHSPMRYLWDQYHIYRNGTGILGRIAMSLFAPQLRMWDVTSAARVDHFVANSTHVANRIRKYWRREATVIHPPVAIEEFKPLPRGAYEDFYLWVGELAPYKRPDMAIEAFNELGRPLIMIGGPEKSRRRLARSAKPNITLLGKVNFETVRTYMARCKALIFPGEEDFGMVPVEVMASGRPVIAFGSGGVLDTVRSRQCGLLYPDQSAAGLIDAVNSFEAEGLCDVDPTQLSYHASTFSEARFVGEMHRFISRTNHAFKNSLNGVN